VPRASRGPAPEEALGRYREALIEGVPAEELARLGETLDPDLVETLHWMRTAGQRARPTPDPLFAKRLERDLLRAFSPTMVEPPTLRVEEPGEEEDAHADVPPPVLLSSRRAGLRGMPFGQSRWNWGQLAAAAVLVLMLTGSLLAVRYVTTGRPQTEFAAVGQPQFETLVDATVEGASAAYTPLSVERWTFQPGGATLTVPKLDGPQWIVAETGPFVATVNGQPQPLAMGQSLVVPAGEELQLRNSGLEAASVLRGVAAAGFSLEDYDRAAIKKETALDSEAHEAIPPGASRVLFERITLPEGASLLAEPATGQDWLGVVSGELGLTLVGDVVPPGWTSGMDRQLGPGDPVPALVPGTSVSLRNLGTGPLVLLRLHVTPLS
jgi:hypothetical protein